MDSFVDDIIIPVRYKSYIDNKRQMKFHAHSMMELIYNVEGDFIFEHQLAPDGEVISSQIFPGQFVVIKPKTLHRHYTLDRTFAMNMESAVSPTLRTNTIDYLLKNAFVKKYEKIKNILQNLEGIYIFDDTEGVYLIIQYLLMLLGKDVEQDELFKKNLDLMLKALLVSISRCPLATSKFGGNIFVNKAVSYIKNNYNKDITVDEIAGYLKVSCSYLQRLFKQTFNCGIMAYINDLRIQKAKYLISTTPLQIKKIAEQVGYKNMWTFENNYKKRFGHSPAKARMQMERYSFFDIDNISRIKDL